MRVRDRPLQRVGKDRRQHGTPRRRRRPPLCQVPLLDTSLLSLPIILLPLLSYVCLIKSIEMISGAEGLVVMNKLCGAEEDTIYCSIEIFTNLIRYMLSNKFYEFET